MKQVVVRMFDELNQVNVERNICASNVMISANDGRKIGTKEQQKALLNDWIAQRANQQHETILSLVSWEIIN